MDAKPITSLRGDVAHELDKLCASYRDLCEQASTAEKAKTSVMESIAQITKRHRLSKVQGRGWLLTKTTWAKEAVKPELLLQHGVSIETVEACTVRTSGESIRILASAAVEEAA